MFHWVGSTVHEFSVRTSLEWELFQRLTCIYLGIPSLDNRIGYRAIRGGVSESLYRLRGADDWESALHAIRTAAEQGRYEAMEIHDASVSPLFIY